MENPVGVIRMIVQSRFMSSIEVRGHENNNISKAADPVQTHVWDIPQG